MRYMVAWTLLAAAAVGCDVSGSPPSAERPVAAHSATPADGQPTATAPAVMAYVNGRPIMMTDLYDMLVRSHGLQAAYQLIADELVRQEAQRQNVVVYEDEVKAETDRIMEDLFGQIPHADQRERLLDQLLVQRGVSYKQWQMIMQRNALLRKLAEPRVSVTEEELAEEFGRQYGRKVQVRHIQTESLISAQKAMDELQAGADFAELAKEVSVNPSYADGGLLPPIGPDSRMVPPALREAALAMKHVGELAGPIQVETAFHILRLEKIIEPQDVDFSEVRDKLVELVRNRRLRVEQQKLLSELIAAAQDAGAIRYIDPVLAAEVRKAEEQAGGE